MTATQKLAYIEKLQNCTDTEIDLVDLLTVGQPLLSQIMKYGTNDLRETLHNTLNLQLKM